MLVFEAALQHQQLFWAGLITVAYLPSTVFPTGPASDGLPIGLQAVSAEYRDYTCIEFARLMADAGLVVLVSVISPYRVGEHTEHAAYASVKRIPSAASRSMCGVR